MVTCECAISSDRVTINTQDAAGNAATQSISIIVDNTPPEVTILKPVDNEAIRGMREILAHVYDLYLKGITIFINDEAVSITSNHTFDTLNYSDGSYKISAQAVDYANNTGADAISVIVDNTPPELYISELNLYPTIDNPGYSFLITTENNTAVTINGAPVVLDNGSAIYGTNITLGVNHFSVTAIDHAGNPSTWDKTILVDGDNLPDWYETNVTGTDPLNNDSDSSKTTTNEAGNDIPDDEEDFDTDTLTNLQEFRLGTDPFSVDTDNDGLTDNFEVFSTGTSPTSKDSDDNGIFDGDEDFDNDTLTNLEEQAYGTDPLVLDTDGDTLDDGEEVRSGTNPLLKDTDNDGLEDNSEVKLGTDPLIADSNGNGIPDGNETYVQTFTNATAGVEATIAAVGDAGKTISIGLEQEPGILITELSDVAKTVDISTASEVKSANIKINYDPAQVSDPSKLRMFHYNDSDNSIHLVDVQGIDIEEHFVWGDTTHLSYYFISDSTYWFEQWYVDWQKPSQVFRPDETIRIKANVRNIGDGTASNVNVKFYADNNLIGSSTISSIAAGCSSLTSVNWVVQSGVGSICVKVDSNNLIAELDEGNNNACKDFSKYLDSDDDGLTDYEEIHGMRVAFPYAYVTTDPFDPDSDDDDLSDGEEMGRVVYDSANKVTYDVLRTINWPEYTAITMSIGQIRGRRILMGMGWKMGMS